MATLKANPKLSRQLTLEGPMLLWRDKADGGREALLLTTDVCENLKCTTRHIGVHALWVEEGLVSASLSRTTITTKSRPGTNEVARPAFFVSLGLDDGSMEPQEGSRTDPSALAWFKTELDTELRAVLLARFEGERRLIRERAVAAEGIAKAGHAALSSVPPGSAEIAMSASMVKVPEPASNSPRTPVGRLGRNDPCPCGSGRKYKRCCLGRTAGGEASG
jgi:hypothetical protein